MAKVSRHAPVLTVSVAAELAGMHPQTVRQYDRIGLVVAKRTRGGGRRYSLNDVEKLIEIQRLSQDEGINLAGISEIFHLSHRIEQLEKDVTRLQRENVRLREAGEYLAEEIRRRQRREQRVFAANSDGDVQVAERLDRLRQVLRENVGTELTVWNPRQVAVVLEEW